jgi:hypothetical protein
MIANSYELVAWRIPSFLNKKVHDKMQLNVRIRRSSQWTNAIQKLTMYNNLFLRHRYPQL